MTKGIPKLWNVSLSQNALFINGLNLMRICSFEYKLTLRNKFEFLAEFNLLDVKR